MIVFILVHVHMTTTGARLTSHWKPMLTGWEEVESIEGHEWKERRRKRSVPPDTEMENK